MDEVVKSVMTLPECIEAVKVQEQIIEACLRKPLSGTGSPAPAPSWGNYFLLPAPLY
jgi:hypothetical protein